MIKKVLTWALIAMLVLAVANAPTVWAKRTKDAGSTAQHVGQGWSTFFTELLS